MAFGWAYQVYLAGPGQEGLGSRAAGCPVWEEAVACLVLVTASSETEAACDVPGQGHPWGLQVTPARARKLRIMEWKSCKKHSGVAESARQCVRDPNLLRASNLPPHPAGGIGTGWVSPRQKQDKLRLGKGEVTLGLYLTWARRRKRKKAYLYVCFTIYVRFLPIPDSVIKCFGVSFCFLMGNKWSKSIPSQYRLACDDGWRTFCFTSVYIAEGIHVTFLLILFPFADPHLNPYGSKLSLGLLSEDVSPFLEDVLYVKTLSVHFDLLLLMWGSIIRPVFLWLKL